MKNGNSRAGSSDLPRLDNTDRKIIAQLISDGRVSFADLGSVLDRFLAFGETTTSIVNASPVPRRDPPLA